MMLLGLCCSCCSHAATACFSKLSLALHNVWILHMAVSPGLEEDSGKLLALLHVDGWQHDVCGNVGTVPLHLNIVGLQGRLC